MSSIPTDNKDGQTHHLTSEDLTEARENISNETKFDHLKADGSNFVEWKKNTARAMKALIGYKRYWDETLPVNTYLDRKRDAIATSVINNTIHNTLKDVTDDADTAHKAMIALQAHFSKGGRTTQFSLFSKAIHLRLDLHETEMITHMAKIDAIVAELESTGFTWSSDLVKGMLYQLHMPAEMTKEINRELDGRSDKKSNFELKQVKSVIQVYLAREKTASETISIHNLSSQVEAMAMNAKHRTPFTPTRTVTQPYPTPTRFTPSTTPN